MSEEKKHEPHPIVKKVFEVARSGFDPIELDAYAVEQLQEELKHLFGKPDLVKAVVDLINLAGILNEQNCSKASLKLMEVVVIATEELKKIKKCNS